MPQYSRFWERLDIIFEAKLKVAREVKIDNPRLVACYWLLTLIAVIAIAIRWFVLLSHTATLPILVSTHVTVNQASFKNMISLNLTSVHLCQESDAWLMPQATCRKMCHFDQRENDCRAPYNVVQQIDSQNIFVAASFSEQKLLEHGSRVEPLGAPDLGDTDVLPALKEFSMHLEYFLEIQGTASWPLERIQRGQSSLEQMTVILDSESKPWKAIPPGQAISLHFADLPVVTAGLPQDLVQAPHRLLKAAAEQGGLIEIVTNCYGNTRDAAYSTTRSYTAFSVYDDFAELVGTYSGSICLISAKWMGERHRLVSYQGGSMKLSQGMKFRSRDGGGFWRVTDLEVSLMSITSAIILLFLPRRIMRAFALTSLGHLSNIYRNALEENFDVRRECADIAVRLMSHSLAFSRLTDKAAPNIIRKEQMFKQLKYILQNHEHEIDNEELHRMVSFCFSTAALNKSFTGAFDEIRSTFKRLRKNLARAGGMKWRLASEKAAPSTSDSMSIDSFMVAATSNEKINFDSIKRLFDKDRYVFCLEKWFTPSELKRAIHENEGQNCALPVPPKSPVLQLGFRSISEISHRAQGPAEQADTRTSTADLVTHPEPPPPEVAAPLPAALETLQWQVAELRRAVGEAQQSQSQAQAAAAQAEQAAEAAIAAAELVAGHRGSTKSLEPKLPAGQVKAVEKLSSKVEGHYIFFKDQLADQSTYCIEQYTRICARFDWLEEQLGFQFADAELSTRISRT